MYKFWKVFQSNISTCKTFWTPLVYLSIWVCLPVCLFIWLYLCPVHENRKLAADECPLRICLGWVERCGYDVAHAFDRHQLILVENDASAIDVCTALFLSNIIYLLSLARYYFLSYSIFKSLMLVVPSTTVYWKQPLAYSQWVVSYSSS